MAVDTSVMTATTPANSFPMTPAFGDYCDRSAPLLSKASP
jgi:hypothetical protein